MAKQPSMRGLAPKEFPTRKSRRLGDVSSETLEHRIAGSGAELASGGSPFGIPSGEIEAARGLRTFKCADLAALLFGATFKVSQKGGAGAAKSHIRRNVVERNHSGVGDTTDGKDLAVLDDNAQRIA